MRFIFAIMAFLFAHVALSEVQPVRIKTVGFYHGTVGTTGTIAMPIASIPGNVVGWKVCNDAVNTSTQLFIGSLVDSVNVGSSLKKGQCFACVQCPGLTLHDVKLTGQAAANGYSVIQYSK